MRAFLVLVLSAFSLTSAAAQSDKADSGNPAVNSTRTVWDVFTRYITTVAEELPESTYAYRPTPEVRTAGQLIGHVANAQYLFCAAGLGEYAPREDNEKTRIRKHELVAALKEPGRPPGDATAEDATANPRILLVLAVPESISARLWWAEPTKEAEPIPEQSAG
jgi:hypothetical protein